ncbi:formate dehydrogenase subunit alpha [Indioceanicola profundi]|uniref:formate dehydrogenase subunit alpha n=1 Tax=Indioceanicola profundi TaxID=2220096 RepID=UPI000E6AC2AE|nr:formate dehydrogenase subunit alpha [Indioceanicola profundi]
MSINFLLDKCEVTAREGETIFDVASRYGFQVPHLCHRPEPGYRPDGNCRACVVEIKGERVLAPSCRRTPAEGMEVSFLNPRVSKAQKMVFELLLADQPAREDAHDPHSHFWNWADRLGLKTSRFPTRERQPAPDFSHPAMAVQLDACIQCGLCARGCREVQANDVIGMAYVGAGTLPVFDFDQPMGDSSCVACGECVQACPTGALLPAKVLDDTGTVALVPDKSVNSVCPYCGVGCQVTFEVKDNDIIAVDGRDGPANANRLCVKGRFGFDYVRHPERLTVPLIRRDDMPKRADDAQIIDPANPWTHFREATWEEALERAAGGLRRIRDTHGGHALAGFGSAKGSNEEAYLFQKLVRTGFGSNNVDHCTRLCHASSVAALMEGIGSGAVTAPVQAALDAEVIFIIGANPTVNHPVAATFIKNAARKGAKLIVADPRGQRLDRFASHSLRIKGGSDVALLSAMLNVIVTEGLVDRQYVQAHVDGYEEFAQNILAFTPEAMSPVCGIEPEVIREVARMYATSRASIVFWGMGISQHVHGTDNARCLIALALLTGQVGRPGTGLHPLRGQNNVQGASDAGLIPMVYPDYRRVDSVPVRELFEEAWGAALDPAPGLTVVEIMKAMEAGDIRGMYVMGENPAMSDPDLAHARAALASLEHLVVQDLFLTETAAYADVVLPASGFPEKTGTFTNTDRRIQIGRQAIDPPGEARQDLWIVEEMAIRLGLPWTHRPASEVFTEMASLMPSLAGITWEMLEERDSVTYPLDPETGVGKEIIFGDAFPTANGRARLASVQLVPPDESPDADYPILLTTGRVLEHWHTGAMTRRAGMLNALEPTPFVSLSRKDMRRMNLEAGSKVRVSTRRGTIELEARPDQNVSPGSAFIPFCYREAAANLLTNPALDPYGKIPEFKICAASISRVEAA